MVEASDRAPEGSFRRIGARVELIEDQIPDRMTGKRGDAGRFFRFFRVFPGREPDRRWAMHTMRLQTGRGVGKDGPAIQPEPVKGSGRSIGDGQTVIPLAFVVHRSGSFAGSVDHQIHRPGQRRPDTKERATFYGRGAEGAQVPGAGKPGGRRNKISMSVGFHHAGSLRRLKLCR